MVKHMGLAVIMGSERPDDTKVPRVKAAAEMTNANLGKVAIPLCPICAHHALVGFGKSFELCAAGLILELEKAAAASSRGHATLSTDGTDRNVAAFLHADRPSQDPQPSGQSAPPVGCLTHNERGGGSSETSVGVPA